MILPFQVASLTATLHFLFEAISTKKASRREKEIERDTHTSRTLRETIHCCAVHEKKEFLVEILLQPELHCVDVRVRWSFSFLFIEFLLGSSVASVALDVEELCRFICVCSKEFQGAPRRSLW